MKLDVGCGANIRYPCSNPKGDVNCDILKPIKKVKNFILCDAQNLPLQDKVFNKVYSSHVIEHVDNPFKMLKELIRVCNGEIVIHTPHRFQSIHVDKTHKCHFTKTWFAKALNKLNVQYKIKYSKYRYFPHLFIPLIKLPKEIKVSIITK